MQMAPGDDSFMMYRAGLNQPSDQPPGYGETWQPSFTSRLVTEPPQVGGSITRGTMTEQTDRNRAVPGDVREGPPAPMPLFTSGWGTTGAPGETVAPTPVQMAPGQSPNMAALLAPPPQMPGQQPGMSPMALQLGGAMGGYDPTALNRELLEDGFDPDVIAMLGGTGLG